MDQVALRPPRVERTQRVRRVGTDLPATSVLEVDADQAVNSAETSAKSHSHQTSSPDAELDPRCGAAADPLQAALFDAAQAGLGQPRRQEAAELRRHAYGARRDAPKPLGDDWRV